MDVSLERLDEILLEHNYDQSALIAVLQQIQHEAGYLPPYVIVRLSETLGVSAARLQALSTFYKCFSLIPTGKHKIAVCTGTACHVRGGTQVLGRLERVLGIQSGRTTPDRCFTLESVRCLGCCSLAPVVVVGGKIYDRVSPKRAEDIIQHYSQE
ncbi:MAG: NAD(P)H-dependent oxidoreductase subunit E, partial [Phycisphaerales bacterium]